MRSVVFDNYGGPEVLKVIEGRTPDITPDEVLIRHTAIGVNRIDVQCRTGAYKATSLPAVCGVEACGVIEKVGDNVATYNVGDRVVYATGPIGAYCTKRAINPKYIIRAPDDIPDDILAASLLKGMTAHYLVHRTFIVSKGMGVLIHDASSTMGQYLSSWASYLGALIIGTVPTDASKQIALDAGCHHVFNYKTEDWVAGIMKCTEGLALNAVYDSIGRETMNKSLECLRMCGIMISFDQPGSSLGSIEFSKLQEKSLFLTCPTLTDYKYNRKELLLSAEEVFAMIREESLKVSITGKYKLEEAAAAHQAVESEQTIGSIILIP